jgi:hypothetical protein
MGTAQEFRGFPIPQNTAVGRSLHRRARPVSAVHDHCNDGVRRTADGIHQDNWTYDQTGGAVGAEGVAIEQLAFERDEEALGTARCRSNRRGRPSRRRYRLPRADDRRSGRCAECHGRSEGSGRGLDGDARNVGDVGDPEAIGSAAEKSHWTRSGADVRSAARRVVLVLRATVAANQAGLAYLPMESPRAIMTPPIKNRKSSAPRNAAVIARSSTCPRFRPHS